MLISNFLHYYKSIYCHDWHTVQKVNYKIDVDNRLISINQFILQKKLRPLAKQVFKYTGSSHRNHTCYSSLICQKTHRELIRLFPPNTRTSIAYFLHIAAMRRLRSSWTLNTSLQKLLSYICSERDMRERHLCHRSKFTYSALHNWSEDTFISAGGFRG